MKTELISQNQTVLQQGCHFDECIKSLSPEFFINPLLGTFFNKFYFILLNKLPITKANSKTEGVISAASLRNCFWYFIQVRDYLGVHMHPYIEVNISYVCAYRHKLTFLFVFAYFPLNYPSVFSWKLPLLLQRKRSLINACFRSDFCREREKHRPRLHTPLCLSPPALAR